MDQDDPERRIAELERQLAEGRDAGNVPVGGWLTPEQVRNVTFSKPPIGKRGYNEDEVDAFIDLIDAALRDRDGGLTAEQVHTVAFSKPPIGKRGYNEDEVDAFLEHVEAQLKAQQRGALPPPRSGAVPPPTSWTPPTPTHSQTWVDRIRAAARNIFG